MRHSYRRSSSSREIAGCTSHQYPDIQYRTSSSSAQGLADAGTSLEIFAQATRHEVENIVPITDPVILVCVLGEKERRHASTSDDSTVLYDQLKMDPQFPLTCCTA